MAAARNLPLPEVTHSIAIDASFSASPAGIVVGYGDTVNFTNNSGSDITVQFLSNSPGQALYPSMGLPVSNGSSAGFQVPSVDCAANYNIQVNGVVENSQPFVIQVGNGPMYVLITGTISDPDFEPGTVAVPLGNITTGLGMLQMKSQVPNIVFPLSWGSDPFNPGFSQSGPAQPVKTGTTPGEYSYSGTNSPRERAGGGRVIIQN